MPRLLVVALVVVASCSKEHPANQPPVANPPPPAPTQIAPAAGVALGPFTMVVPAAWTPRKITSNMRAADYDLPAAAGEDAELVIYYFGEHGAGSTDDNITRWLGQFTQPDGKPSRDVAKIDTTKIAGQDATLVSVAGHFVAAAMPGGSAVDKQNQAMLGAIIASPSGPYYFKLVGAAKTVEAHAAEFRALLDSLTLHP
jgi:hypothetical protein